MNTQIKIFNSTDELADYLGKLWNDGIAALDDGGFYSIALSGGNTPVKIFKHLAEHYKKTIYWSKIKFFWGDERCVPPDDDDSNYKSAKDNLFDSLNIPAENIFRIKGEENPDAEAKRYSAILQKELLIKNGIPQFDFVLLGLGEDGHTASIFPYEINLFDSPNNCEPAAHPVSGQKRITITGRIINCAKTIAFMSVGISKSEKVYEIINKTRSSKAYPAALVKPDSGKLLWLLDKESAEKL